MADNYDREAARIADSIYQAFAENEGNHSQALNKARDLYLAEEKSSPARFDFYRREFNEQFRSLDAQSENRTLTLADICDATNLVVARRWRATARK